MYRFVILFAVLAASIPAPTMTFAQDGAYGSVSCDACGDCCCGGCNGCCGGWMGGDLWTRDYLFGDWHGLRNGLEEHGIVADLEFTQFYQDVASGGLE